MGEEQLKIVKDYIKKYNLEDELSNAVNQAIKLDSDDPYRVISDYLRKFAKEQDEDEDDDDDDVMQEGDEPVMRAAGRRQQVAAKKFEVPDDWSPPIRAEKSPEDKAFLEGVMASNKLMKNLSPSDRDQLLKAFDGESFDAGTAIITQGDGGDKFYVLASGTCDITIAGKGSVMKATKGIAFGELALLHGAPRAATVTAEEPVTAWSLDEITFKMILMGKAKKDTADYTGFLGNVPILQHLKEEERQEMAGCLKEEVYDENKNIICEGDSGTTFYLIRDGEVKCTKVGHAEEVSKRLIAGDFFGELALLSADGDKRAATVTAVKKTTVLVMQKPEFTRLLGELKPPQY